MFFWLCDVARPPLSIIPASHAPSVQTCNPCIFIILIAHLFIPPDTFSLFSSSRSDRINLYLFSASPCSLLARGHMLSRCRRLRSCSPPHPTTCLFHFSVFSAYEIDLSTYFLKIIFVFASRQITPDCFVELALCTDSDMRSKVVDSESDIDKTVSSKLIRPSLSLKDTVSLSRWVRQIIVYPILFISHYNQCSTRLLIKTLHPSPINHVYVTHTFGPSCLLIPFASPSPSHRIRPSPRRQKFAHRKVTRPPLPIFSSISGSSTILAAPTTDDVRFYSRPDCRFGTWLWARADHWLGRHPSGRPTWLIGHSWPVLLPQLLIFPVFHVFPA